MFAVFARRQSELSKQIIKSLPQRETSLLTLIDLSERPSFALSITPADISLDLYLEGQLHALTGGLALSFPAFYPPPDIDNPDYYSASWQSAYLALLEALLPNLAPHASAADWIASFELSYPRRPALAARLEVSFPPSRLIEGEYIPRERELVYSLDTRSILPTLPGTMLNGFLEVFPAVRPTQLHSAVVLKGQCWLTRFTPEGLQPGYHGSINGLGQASIQSLLARAAAEWGLASLLFLFDDHAPSLVQVRFDIEPALHPAHYPSFAQAAAAFAADHA